MKKLVLLNICALLLCCACASPTPVETPDGAYVSISFTYVKQSGYASNQFAVWIEDTDGGFVKTLYATRFTANGGWKDRSDALPEWISRSGLAEKGNVDAVSGATPKGGDLAYFWDCTDENGELVSDGVYLFFVEGNLRWEARVLYWGEIEVGSDAVDATASAEFFGENIEERNMLGSVRAVYSP